MQPIRVLARNHLPWLYDIYIERKKMIVKERLKKMNPFREKKFRSILTDDLGLRAGDTVFIHSSFNRMRLSITPTRVVEILIETVGEEGTLCVPTYPPMNSTDFLKSKQVFDVRNTPSRTGVITEIIRTLPGSKRSLHPTKSVSAIGKMSEYIVRDHHLSPYPYDKNSPYFKIIDLEGKYIGLGVNSYYIASLHCVDDIMKDDYPVYPYYKKIFKSRCIDMNGRIIEVQTLSHPLYKTDYDMHRFINKYIPKSVCRDLMIEEREFFIAKMKPLYEIATELARKNITIYPRSSYRLKYMFR